MKNQLQEFKKFIMRGNVVDLAVAVVVGTAFSAVVTALVTNILTPLIAAIVGQPDFSNLSFTINGSEFKYGLFLNALISFLSVAIVVFFFVVQPLNKLQAIANRNKKSEDPTTKKCPECLSEIPKDAIRCAFCTARQPEAEAIAKSIQSAKQRRNR
jgi:large conductance mechanosensitive channel